MIFIIKPTHRCNLRCKYCYVANDFKNNDIDLSCELACLVIDRIYEFAITKGMKNITLLWHGGEPLLWGKSNYEYIFDYCEKKNNIKIAHSIQTNLTLIDEEYILLFKRFSVNVGFSIDGFPEVNDKTRVFINGNGTSEIIEQKIELCKYHDLKIGAIVVATSVNIYKVEEIYHYMSNLGIGFKLNPIFRSGEANKSYNELGISPYEYSDAMIKLFDIWTQDASAKIEISILKEIASNLATGKPNTCCFKKNCQDNFTTISPSGDIFPCSRFCDPKEYCFGNVGTVNFDDALEIKKNLFKYERLEKLKKNDCKGCKYFNICNGGCIHDAYTGGTNIFGKTYLCNSYKKIFSHVEKYLKENNIELFYS